MKHAFIDEGVLILKKDGTTDRPFILVNERVIPDLNLEDYLKRKASSIGAVKGATLESRETIHVSSKEPTKQQDNLKHFKPEPGNDASVFFAILVVVLVFAIIIGIIADS